jgi:hypothetical protein
MMKKEKNTLSIPNVRSLIKAITTHKKFRKKRRRRKGRKNSTI